MGQRLALYHSSTVMDLTAAMLGRTLLPTGKEPILLSKLPILPVTHIPDQTPMGESICIMCGFSLETTRMETRH